MTVNNLNFPISTPQSAIFGFRDSDTNEHLTLNHLLLTFKLHIYTTRIGYLNTNHLLTFTKSTKDTEKKLCENDAKTCTKINKKWKNILINQLTLTNFYLGCTYTKMKRI